MRRIKGQVAVQVVDMGVGIAAHLWQVSKQPSRSTNISHVRPGLAVGIKIAVHEGLPVVLVEASGNPGLLISGHLQSIHAASR